MNLSRPQQKLFTRLNQQLNTSPAYFQQHLPRIIRDLHSSLRSRYVIVFLGSRLIKHGLPKLAKYKSIMNYNKFKRVGLMWKQRKPMKKQQQQHKKSRRLRGSAQDGTATLRQRKQKKKKEPTVDPVVIEIDDDEDEVKLEPTIVENENVSYVDASMENTEKTVTIENVSLPVEMDGLAENSAEFPTEFVSPEEVNMLMENYPETEKEQCEEKDVSNPIEISPESGAEQENVPNPIESTLKSGKDSDLKTKEVTKPEDDEKTEKSTEEETSSEEDDSDASEVEDDEEQDATEDAEKPDGFPKILSAISLNPTSVDIDTPIPSNEADMNKALRQQLSLLQMGRRRESIFFPAPSITAKPLQKSANNFLSKSPTNSGCTTPSLVRHISQSSLEDNTTTTATPNKTDEQSESTKSVKVKPTEGTVKRNFIDSLLTKIKLNTSNEGETDVADSNRNDDDNNDDDDDVVSIHSADSEFHGFQAIDAERRPVLLLPTPILPAHLSQNTPNSAFISEELDNFMIENSLETAVPPPPPPTVKRRRHIDEAMMSTEATPPELAYHEHPDTVEKPRTLAEKRLLLERTVDFKYYMIENESTIYREIRKRARFAVAAATATSPSSVKPATVNAELIRNIQEQNVPFTRDCWRASSWLNTQNGRFYFQTFRTETGDMVKILSGRGNNKNKCIYELPKLSRKSAIAHKAVRCRGKCHRIDHLKINNLEAILPPVVKSPKKDVRPAAVAAAAATSKMPRLNTLNVPSFMRPAPLSQKVLAGKRCSIDMEIGPLEIFRMPAVRLEVCPRIDRPLPEVIRPYLHLAMPFEKMTDEWAAFAVSTLVVPKRPLKRGRRRKSWVPPPVEENSSSSVGSTEWKPIYYSFNIPYTNNQTNILVRRRNLPGLKNGGATASRKQIDIKSETFTFNRSVDKMDSIAMEAADVLAKMIDSVSLSFDADAMLQIDPDALEVCGGADAAVKKNLETTMPTCIDAKKNRATRTLM